MLLVGAVCLNGIPLAMLMRDPSYLKQTSEQTDEDEMSPLAPKQHSQVALTVLNEHSKTKESEENEILLPLVAKSGNSGDLDEGCFPTGTVQQDRRTHFNRIERDREKRCVSLWNQFGLFLLADRKFVMILVCVNMTNLSHISLHWFIPDRAIEIGLSNRDAAMTITIINVANILSRLIFGTASSDSFTERVVVLCAYVFISGLNSIFIFLWTSYWTFMLFSGFYGLLKGLFVIHMLLVIVDIVDEDHVSLGLGLLHTFTGIVFVISIPTFGYLNEVTHSYVMTFVLYGSLEIFGGLFLVAIPINVCLKYFKNARYVPLLP